MSGKAAGKAHNRAAQSQQHGFQEPVDVRAQKRAGGRRAQALTRSELGRQELLAKIRYFEQSRREQEAER